MSERRSRRRFLADMLFLGGGLTAAAMLARGGCGGVESDPVQHPSKATPADPFKPEPPMPGQMVMPQENAPATLGEPTMPEQVECVKKKPPAPDPIHPPADGKTLLPKYQNSQRPEKVDPNPAGGMGLPEGHR